MCNSASGDLFHMKLTEDIEEKLGKTLQALSGHKAGFTLVTRIKGCFWLNLRKGFLLTNKKE